jgi:Threonine dehydratase
MGSAGLLDEMWPLVSKLVDAHCFKPETNCRCNKIIDGKKSCDREGAGGSSFAAALTGKAGTGKIVCVISGGNIDAEKLIKILSGTMA